MTETTGLKVEELVCQDEAVLRQLGYKQVLYRSWGAFTAITITISAMSVLTSISGGAEQSLVLADTSLLMLGTISGAYYATRALHLL